jgi:hypothetical protein
MKKMPVLAAIKKLNRQVFTTREIEMLHGASAPAATQALNRLAKSGILLKVRKGVWALQIGKGPLSPYSVIQFIMPVHRAYVSFLSALHLHGIIEQIPQSVMLASTAHTRTIKTKLGTFYVHKISAGFFKGFGWYRGTGEFLIAEPEKALIDCLYLSARKKRQFGHFPELHFPKFFSFKKAQRWAQEIPDRKIKVAVLRKLNTLKTGLILVLLFSGVGISALCFAQVQTPLGQIERSEELIRKEEDLREKIAAPEKIYIEEIVLKGSSLLSPEEIKNLTSPYEKKWLTDGDLTISTGTVKSDSSGVTIYLDTGSLYATGGGPHVVAHGDSYISTPYGTITVTGQTLNVEIHGNLILNIGAKVGGFSGRLNGYVAGGGLRIPLFVPSSYPFHMYPPGKVFFNGRMIWPSLVTFLLSQAYEVLNHSPLLPDSQQLTIYQYNTAHAILALFYHPLTEYDMAAFDQFILEEGAYEFINGQINILGHDGLLPILEEIKKRHKTTI